MKDDASDKFSSHWSRIRQQIDSGAPVDAAEIASVLDAAADGVSQRILIAAPLLQLAGRESDEGLRRQAVARLHGARPQEVQGVIKALPDLTVIGSIEDRCNVLGGAILGDLPEDDLARAFLSDPTATAAESLHDYSWRAPVGFGTKLAREVRLWVLWTALWKWLDTRQREFRLVLTDESLSKEGAGPPGWEFRVIVAVEQLSRSDLDGALSTLELIRSDRTLPERSHRSLTRMLATFAPLAGQDAQRWLQKAPDPLPTQQMAIDSLQRAAFDFPDLCGLSPVRPNARIAKHRQALEDHSWLAFSYFTTASAPSVREAAALALKNAMSSSDRAARCWPWVKREPCFAKAAQQLTDDRQTIALLSAALDAVQHQSLRRAAKDVLNTCEPGSLVAVANSQLANALQGEFQQLRTARQRIIQRGGIFRAVVDGSNVVWGGRSRRHGAEPDICLVDQTLKDLSDNGFEEVRLFFDARTRWVGSNEWSGWERVSQWQANGTATVTPGVADTHIIADYMLDPQHSVIVTCDAYRDHLQKLQDFRPWAQRCFVRFFVDQNQRIQWERPLSEPRYLSAKEAD